MKHPVAALLPLIATLLLSACGGHEKPLATVNKVDLQRYAGTWYEIARLPQWFQRGCYDSTATYSLNDDGTVKVINRCQREGEQTSEAEGTARVVPGSDNAKLKVRFDNWVSRLIPTITEGNYWIIALDKDYQTVVIGEPRFWRASQNYPKTSIRRWYRSPKRKGSRSKNFSVTASYALKQRRRTAANDGTPRLFCHCRFRPRPSPARRAAGTRRR